MCLDMHPSSLWNSTYRRCPLVSCFDDGGLRGLSNTSVQNLTAKAIEYDSYTLHIHQTIK